MAWYAARNDARRFVDSGGASLTGALRSALVLDPERAELVIQAAQSKERVNGLTHALYKYPARFSPNFAKAAIEAFTKPGDLVLDPFMGGGTSLIEALAAGRRAAGTDISSLAAFLSKVKTTVYSEREIDAISLWAKGLRVRVGMHLPATPDGEWVERGYLRNLEGARNWRLRKAIEQAVAYVPSVETPRLKGLARTIILRAAQWALEAKKNVATIEGFRAKLEECACDAVAAAQEFRERVLTTDLQRNDRRAHCLHGPATNLPAAWLKANLDTPRLVVTSPPYPGVHVLYHRWQVDGRKETPAPFWITGQLDGAGITYYAMGDRKQPRLDSYYDNLRQSFSAIAEVCDQSTIFVQLIAFSDPSWQLPRYLETMNECGLEELELSTGAERIWRDVPNRKWYTDYREQNTAGRELLLLHRLA